MKSILILVVLTAAFVLNVSASETAKGMKKDYETFKQEMSVKLEETEKRINELKAEAQTKGDQTQTKTIQTLEETRAKLTAELEEAKTAGKSGWQNFKKNFAESVDRLNTKVQDALKD